MMHARACPRSGFAVRALRGESDGDAVLPAPSDASPLDADPSAIRDPIAARALARTIWKQAPSEATRRRIEPIRRLSTIMIAGRPTSHQKGAAMPDRSAAIAAAVRAMRGESDLAAVHPALDEDDLALVVALAPGVHPVVRAVAALRGWLTALLAPADIASPALHAAIVHVIGTPIAQHVLTAWAHIMPAGWGRTHAAARIDDERISRRAPGVAAALIGPDDRSASLLRLSDDAAFAIRHWGATDPADPTAWTKMLAPAERDRLLTIVDHDPIRIAFCRPWLPPDVGTQTRLDERALGVALTTFAAASPTARALHADLLRQIIADARPSHLAELTRLACAMQTDEVWDRVQTLIRESPDDADLVVAAAPWDALPATVGAAMRTCAAQSDVCAAIVAAQGETGVKRISPKTAAAFFAALDPDVWDALGRAAQQRWLQALTKRNAPLAVRSLGLRPEVLARARLDNDLVLAAGRHAPDAAALRAALLPVALRSTGFGLATAYALIAAMPTMPPDPGAFFIIAGGGADPSVITPARATLRTLDDLACAVALQRQKDIATWTPSPRALLQHALRERTWDDLARTLALLDDDARAALMPDREEVVDLLAHPDHRERIRAVIDRLAALPPAVAIPTQVALHRWVTRRAHPSDAADAVAAALHAHGDVLLEIADGLADAALRAALLPLPKRKKTVMALRALVRDDPVGGRALACALHDRAWRRAIPLLLTAPSQHAAAVWQALTERERRAIVGVLPAGAQRSDLRAARDPAAALALAALQSGDPDLRDASVTALAQRPATLRARWDDLPPEARHALRTHPAVAVVVADLGHPPPSPSAPTGRTRRIHR